MCHSCWFRGPKSKLPLENKAFINKCIVKPICLALGCAKVSTAKIIQMSQLNVLVKEPFYITKLTVLNDLNILLAEDE